MHFKRNRPAQLTQLNQLANETARTIGDIQTKWHDEISHNQIKNLNLAVNLFQTLRAVVVEFLFE